MEKQGWANVTPGSSPSGRLRGRGAKACRSAYEAAGVIRISDDSSTESDAGLDSDFHSSPESLVDDDVVIVDAIGLPADDRGENFPSLDTGTGFREGKSAPHSWSAAKLDSYRQSGVRMSGPQGHPQGWRGSPFEWTESCEWAYGQGHLAGPS